jgi:glycosyltransferase involved in cell wall biosynthesis
MASSTILPRIVVDARMVQSTPHGIGRYVSLAARGIEELRNSDPFSIPFEPRYLLDPKANPDPDPRSFPMDRIHWVDTPFLSLTELRTVPQAVRNIGAEAFWSPSFASFPMLPCPWLVTIHDLNHLHFGSTTKRLYYRFALKPFARRAKRILTVSEFSRGEIASWLEIDRSRVAVIPNAIDPDLVMSPIESASVSEDPYFLCVGSDKDHKNIPKLVDAYALWREEREARALPCWELKIAGSVTPPTVNYRTGVKWLGPVSDDVLSALMTRASAMIFPSLYEGFGLPPIEAAALGTPVVASDIPAHREVLSGIADIVTWFDPKSESDMARSFTRIAYKPLTKQQLEKAAEAIQTRFTTEKMVSKLVEILASTAVKDQKTVVPMSNERARQAKHHFRDQRNQRQGGHEQGRHGLSTLRVALAHEWLDGPGGAENVLRQMIEVFPQADVWSLWCLSPAKDTIPLPVNTTWLARTPLAGHKMAALPLMPIAWRTLPRRNYDIVVTSTYGLAHTAKFRGNRSPTLHYVHTPARYWWTPEVDSRAGGRLAAGPRWAMRVWDRRLGSEHRYVAANSAATRDRIRRFWGVDARIIHPPVDTDFFTSGSPESPPPFSEYIFGASRWVAYKRLDRVIETAQAAGLPVVIAGSGPEESRLRALAAEVNVPVHFEVQPTRERLRDLYRGAQALVFPVHEDFGIVPVEAMACGTPVVGPAIGGLLESVEEGVSGSLTQTASPQALSEAVLAATDLPASEVRASALRFSNERFRDEFTSWIAEVIRS